MTGWELLPMPRKNTQWTEKLTGYLYLRLVVCYLKLLLLLHSYLAFSVLFASICRVFILLYCIYIIIFEGFKVFFCCLQGKYVIPFCFFTRDKCPSFKPHNKFPTHWTESKERSKSRMNMLCICYLLFAGLVANSVT